MEWGTDMKKEHNNKGIEREREREKGERERERGKQRKRERESKRHRERERDYTAKPSLLSPMAWSWSSTQQTCIRTNDRNRTSPGPYHDILAQHDTRTQ